MTIFRRVIGGIRSLVQKKRAERELDEELREYLEMETEDKIAAGMSREQASRAARLELGSVEAVKDQVRDVGWESFVESFWQDLRYGCRSLSRNRSFAAAAMLIVALGIGATTAIFSVVYSVAVERLPYGDPENLVRIRTKSAGFNFEGPTVSGADAQDLRKQNTVFEDIALVRTNTNLNFTGDGEPERLNAARVMPNLFSVLRIQPAFGRAFRPDEDQEGKQFVVLLSDGLWKRRFNGDRNIIGKVIRLNDQRYTIVGVMSADFRYPGRDIELWTPLVIGADEYQNRIQYEHQGVARLKTGIQLSQAQAELDTISARLARDYAENTGVTFRVVPILDEMVSSGLRSSLYLLFGAVALLLLVGCANLANLLLARTISRSREFHVRAALGARTGRLMGQSIAEVAPIVIVGGVIGLVVADWGLRLLIPFLPATMPRVEAIRMSGPIFVFAAGVLVLTAIVVGALPAFQIRRQDIAQSLHDSFRGTSTGASGAKARELIVISQIAMAVVLLIGAGLLIRSYSQLIRVDPGFRTDNVLSLLLAIPRAKYERSQQVNAFCAEIIERVGTVSGVEAVGMVNRLPLGGVGQVGTVELEGIRPTPVGLRHVDWRSITPDYFLSIGVPLKKGRLFNERDTADALPVAIIDERVAEMAWPNEDPIGKRFRVPFPGQPWLEIVGVVGRIRHDRLDADTQPTFYWNYLQRAQDRMALVVRTSTDTKALTASIISAIRSVDPDQPVYDVRSMTDVVDRSVSQQWLNTVLLGIFAGASLILASIGIYGVTSYAVGQRKREFAIRIALGAERHNLIRSVLNRAAIVVAIGIGIGVSGAFLLGRMISTLLFDVGAADWTTFSVCIVILVCVAMLASYVPARRAAKTDPIKHLI